MPSKEEIAWFAGLYEGEGFLSHQSYACYLFGIGMTDREIVERARNVGFNYGAVREFAGRTERHKNMFYWRVYKKEHVFDLCNMIYNLLGQRRRNEIDNMRNRVKDFNKTKDDRLHLAKCGTYSAYSRHIKRKEPIDEACRLAAREHQRNYRRNKLSK